MNRAARERSTELRVALHIYYDNQRVAKMRTLWYNITMIIIVILYHSKGDSCMPGINYWAVVVAAVAAFVASAAWDIVFGQGLAKVSAVFCPGIHKPPSS